MVYSMWRVSRTSGMLTAIALAAAASVCGVDSPPVDSTSVHSTIAHSTIAASLAGHPTVSGRHRDSVADHRSDGSAELPGAVAAEIGVTTTAADAADAADATRAKVQSLIDACTAAGIAPADIRLADLLSAPVGAGYRTQATVRITLRGSVPAPVEALAATIAADGPSVYLERVSATE
jgi:uncharacterized protein YggE